MVVLGLLWIPFIGMLSEERMYVYLQSVQGYISPPIAAVFLFGVFWRRINARGAMAALITGLLLGAARFVLEIMHKLDPFISEPFLTLATVNFLHVAIVLFVICSVVLVGVSLATEAPAYATLANLTFRDTPRTDAAPSPMRRVNRAMSVLLVLVLVFLWWMFR